MSDRELIERAARAAGLKHLTEWSDKITDWDSQHHGRPALHSNGPGGQCNSWNPLNDDGDALRLAVKLDIIVRQKFAMVTAEYPWVDEELNNRKALCEGVLDDRYAATRRAIVRAASAIAKLQSGAA
ncbi:MAG: hypothetical protein JWP38_3723 [Herbaspirillum sp.]|nr:hypothetical protein [Herbaspirillum sp.]